MNVLEAAAHPQLFAPWFKDRDTWARWIVFLAALFGLPMDDEARAIFRQHTGRDEPPTEASREAWLVIGRRGGKSFMMALTAVYLACFREYRQHLQPGERATVMLIAAERKQARLLLRYIRGLLTNIPSLKLMVERETAEAFDLDNCVTIEVGTASNRTTRGYSFAAVLADELAFWPTGDDVAEPDDAILDAVRPGMTTIPGSMLLCASSPYARRGALWDAFDRYWGKPDKPLVWKATTREMNPTVPQEDIDLALERDYAANSAEYLAEFRNDLESYVDRDKVLACVSPGVYERPPQPGFAYFGFVDPSGGRADSMTLAIGHREGDRAVIDALYERQPPFSPEAIVGGYARNLKDYGISVVYGDRYGGEWPPEMFRRNGITYLFADQAKSGLYQDMLPVLNSGRLDLLDDDRAVNQIASLERKVARGGRESIDHPPRGHDDLANVIAGVVGLCLRRPEPATALCTTYSYGWDGDEEIEPFRRYLLDPGNEDLLSEYRARRRDRGGSR